MTEDDFVWSAKLDDRYLCLVKRTAEYNGILRIFDEDTLLMEKEVGLSYGAIFGPDIEDVLDWQEECANFIDAL